jgi:hypothetical protein
VHYILIVVLWFEISIICQYIYTLAPLEHKLISALWNCANYKNPSDGGRLSVSQRRLGKGSIGLMTEWDLRIQPDVDANQRAANSRYLRWNGNWKGENGWDQGKMALRMTPQVQPTEPGRDEIVIRIIHYLGYVLTLIANAVPSLLQINLLCNAARLFQQAVSKRKFHVLPFK